MGTSERQTRAAAAAAMASGGGGGGDAETRGSSVSTAKRSARSRKAIVPAEAAVTATTTARDEPAANEDEVKQQAPQSTADATPSSTPLRVKKERRTAAAATAASQQPVATSEATGRTDEVSTVTTATAVSVVKDTDMKPPIAGGNSIPACLKVRIAASPPTVIAAPSHTHTHDGDDNDRDGDRDDDMGEFEDASEAAAAALRIDAAASGGVRSNTSPTSVASAPTSPADDSGLNTPNGSEGSALATKRRRLEDPPMFLEKTYEMLEKCSPEIAGWSVPAGDSFVVKKPIEFAEHVIPAYFKHRNFSSFVRQLNFYGFRKVRVDAETAASIDPKEWWEFRHDKFVRGRRDLLREIKRRTIADGRSTIERAEMDELRAEVFALKEQVQLLNKHMMRVMEAFVASSSSKPSGATASGAVTDSGDSSCISATRSPSASGRDRHYQPAPQQHAATQGVSHMHLPSMMHHSQTQLATHHHTHHHHALGSLHQGLSAPVSKSSTAAAATAQAAARAPLIPSSIAKGSSIGGFPQQLQQQPMDAPPRSPVTSYQLRPLQSVVPSVLHLPPGATTTTAGSHLSPVFTYRSGPGSAPAGMSFVDRVEWSRYTPHHQATPQQQHSYESQPRFATAAYPSGQERTGGIPPTASLRRAEMPARHSVTGYKRTHDDFPSTSSGNSNNSNRSAGAMRETPPDAAVRQLSMTATQTRSELLSCIIARILGFIRIQQQQQARSGEVNAVADAVVSDIQQLLARVQEPVAPNSPAAAAAVASHPSGNSEAACMYRVEILKFISRELPRAVQESVEKRIPPQVKKHLNRSLLALLVQKAQAALEHQMRIETAPSVPPAMHPITSGASAGAAASSGGATMHR